MSGPVPSPSMNGITGRSGAFTRKARSYSIAPPDVGGVRRSYAIACSFPFFARFGTATLRWKTGRSSAAFVDRDVAEVALPNVLGARPDEAVVRVLSLHVRDPPADARDREDGREEVGRYSQRVVRGGAEEIHVRVDSLFCLHRRQDLFAHPEPAGVPRAL